MAKRCQFSPTVRCKSHVRKPLSCIIDLKAPGSDICSWSLCERTEAKILNCPVYYDVLFIDDEMNFCNMIAIENKVSPISSKIWEGHFVTTVAQK